MTRTRHRRRGPCGEGCADRKGGCRSIRLRATRHQPAGCGRRHQPTGRLGAGSLLGSAALAKMEYAEAFIVVPFNSSPCKVTWIASHKCISHGCCALHPESPTVHCSWPCRTTCFYTKTYEIYRIVVPMVWVLSRRHVASPLS